MRVQPWALICTTPGAEWFPKMLRARAATPPRWEPWGNKNAAHRRLSPHRSVSYSDPYGLKPCSLWLFSSNFCTWSDFKENICAVFCALRSETLTRVQGSERGW